MEISELQQRVLDDLAESIASTDPALAAALSTFDLAPLDGRRTDATGSGHPGSSTASRRTAARRADLGARRDGSRRDRLRLRVSACGMAVVVLAIGVVVACFLPGEHGPDPAILLAAGVGCALVAVAGIAAELLITSRSRRRRALDAWPPTFERFARCGRR